MVSCFQIWGSRPSHLSCIFENWLLSSEAAKLTSSFSSMFDARCLFSFVCVRFCFSLCDIFIATEFHPRLTNMQLHNQSLRSIDPIVFTLQFMLIHCNLATKLLNILFLISEWWSFSLALPPFCALFKHCIYYFVLPDNLSLTLYVNVDCWSRLWVGRIRNIGITSIKYFEHVGKNTWVRSMRRLIPLSFSVLKLRLIMQILKIIQPKTIPRSSFRLLPETIQTHLGHKKWLGGLIMRKALWRTGVWFVQLGLL